MRRVLRYTLMPYIAERVLSFFFFQAEDGIRDSSVTGGQTCALPIYLVCRLLLEKKNITSVNSTGTRAQAASFATSNTAHTTSSTTWWSGSMPTWSSSCRATITRVVI